MTVSFSQLPGRHERHYRRKLDNPLFADRAETRDDERLLEMQRLDHEELLGFIEALRSTVQRAVDLKPNEESDVILALKEQLDRLFEQSAGLADEQSGNQGAIRELLAVIMRNVERGAAADPQALDELEQEHAAREAHFTLLMQPLVADLLHPESTIGPGELAPSLLSESEPAVAAVLQLFDLAQLRALQTDAERCLADCADPPSAAGERLQQIAAQIGVLQGAQAMN